MLFFLDLMKLSLLSFALIFLIKLALKYIFTPKNIFDMWKRHISLVYCTNFQRKWINISSEIIHIKVPQYYEINGSDRKDY